MIGLLYHPIGGSPALQEMIRTFLHPMSDNQVSPERKEIPVCHMEDSLVSQEMGELLGHMVLVRYLVQQAFHVGIPAAQHQEILLIQR